MKNKWKPYTLPLLAVIVIFAAVLYVKSVSFDTYLSQSQTPMSSPGTTSEHVKASSTPPPAVVAPLPASAAMEEMLTTEQMTKDLDYLVKTLLEVHPRLINGWNSGEQKTVEAAYSKIRHPLPLAEFYFIANEITMLLHDGHTSIYSSVLEQQVIDLPLFWSREGLVLTDDRGKLKTGDTVIAIGGTSTGDLEKELAKVIPAENNYWVRYKGIRLLRAEFFLRHLGLVTDGRTDVTVLRGDRIITDSIRVPGEKLTKEYSPFTNYNVPFTYLFDEDLSLGIFQLNDCIVNNSYKDTVKQFFDEVRQRGIQHIAVDLRNNSGGNSEVVTEFLSYVDVKSYYSFGSVKRFSPQVEEVYHTGQDSGYAKYDRPLITNPMKRNHLPYTGKLYALTSPLTFSSANWFALILQDNRLGTVIGQPTGNQPSSYGNVLPFSLPSSGFHFQVSFMRWSRPDPGKDPADAVYPDIEAYTSIQDIIERRDAQFEKLREVVTAQNALTH